MSASLPARAKRATFASVARLAAAESGRTACELAAIPCWDDASIHRIRVLCKRLRAVVHLGRGLVKDRERREWNQSIRKAAKMLSATRDGDILKEWMSLAAKHAPRGCVPGIGRLRATLAADFPNGLPAGAREAVLELLGRIAELWPAVWHHLSRSPEAGLRHMRQAARESAAEAMRDPHPEAWHLWRRRVKYAAYQMEWMAAAAGKKPGERCRNWRKLGSALGKVNDMYNLEGWLAPRRSRSAGFKYLAEWTEEARHQWEKQARAQARGLRMGR